MRVLYKICDIGDHLICLQLMHLYHSFLYHHQQYEQAYDSYLRCVDICQQMMDKDNLARMVHGLGMTCTQLQKWDEAQVNFERAFGSFNCTAISLLPI